LLPGKLTLLPLPRWTRAHELLSQQKIQKGDIAQIVRESDVMLRYGCGFGCLQPFLSCSGASRSPRCLLAVTFASAPSPQPPQSPHLPPSLPGLSSNRERAESQCHARSLSSLRSQLTPSCSETASDSLESRQGAARGTGAGQSSLNGAGALGCWRGRREGSVPASRGRFLSSRCNCWASPGPLAQRQMSPTALKLAAKAALGSRGPKASSGSPGVSGLPASDGRRCRLAVCSRARVPLLQGNGLLAESGSCTSVWSSSRPL